MDFVLMLKELVRLCSPFARIAGTGTGMVTLLTAVHDATPNGVELWRAMGLSNHNVVFGHESRPPVALAMAARILDEYASARRWPRDFAALLTPQRACEMLSRDATGGFASPRPALEAFLGDLAGSGQLATPPVVLAEAKMRLERRLHMETRFDLYTALARMMPSLRLWLRDRAGPGATPSESYDEAFRALGGHLSEDEPPDERGPSSAHAPRARLLPPYGALLQELFAPDGSSCVVYSYREDSIDFEPVMRRNLDFLLEHTMDHSKVRLSPRARQAVSSSVLESFERNGIGFSEGVGAAVRAPTSLDEVLAVPAFARLHEKDRFVSQFSRRPGRKSKMRTLPTSACSCCRGCGTAYSTLSTAASTTKASRPRSSCSRPRSSCRPCRPQRRRFWTRSPKVSTRATRAS